jgi:hypothetical protein
MTFQHFFFVFSSKGINLNYCINLSYRFLYVFLVVKKDLFNINIKAKDKTLILCFIDKK